MVEDMTARGRTARPPTCLQSKNQAVTLPVSPVQTVSTPWRLHALGFIAMGSILAIMSISPVIPLYLDQRGLPPVHVGGIIGAMSLALIVTEVLALGVTSRVGRRAAGLASLVMVPAATIVRPVRDDSPNPLRSYAALLSRAPSVRRMFLVTVMNTIAYGILTTFLPLHAAANGLSTAEIGLIFTGGGVAFIVVQAVLHRIADRITADRLLIPAYVIRGLGISLVPLLTSFPALFVATFLGSLGAAAIPNALSIRISARAPRSHMA